MSERPSPETPPDETPPDETPPGETPPDLTSRQRLWRGLRHGSRSQVLVALLLALVGFAGVTQVRSADDDSSYAGYREQDLIDVLNGLAGTTQRAQTELSRLEQRREDLQNSTRRDQAALDEARSQVDTLNVLAGLVPVTGPGIRVTITEKTSEVDVDSFLDLVQELRSVGAEAMAVNGQVRLVARSSFEQAAGGLVVDGKLLEPPYVVDVIGEPTTLVNAVIFLHGPQDEFEKDGATVSVEKRNSLDLPAVRDRGDGSSGGAGSSGTGGAQ